MRISFRGNAVPGAKNDDAARRRGAHGNKKRGEKNERMAADSELHEWLFYRDSPRLTTAPLSHYHTRMIWRLNASQRPWDVLLVGLHLLFIIGILAPDVVWCHHLDGKAHLECMISDCACPCDPPPRLREKPSGAIPGPAFERILSKDTRCWHESVLPDVDRSSLQRSVGESAVSAYPEFLLRPALPSGPDVFSGGAPISPPPPLFAGGFAAIEALRC